MLVREHDEDIVVPAANVVGVAPVIVVITSGDELEGLLAHVNLRVGASEQPCVFKGEDCITTRARHTVASYIGA